jgi:phage terminase small subunit
MAQWRNLNKREARFVEEYFACAFNGTQAAIKAGYSKRRASQTASDLLKREPIQAALAERAEALTKDTNLEAMAVITELKRIGFSDIRDAVEWDQENGVRLRPSDGLDEDVARTISEVSVTETAHGRNMKIKQYDKPTALSMLGKYHALFVDINRHEGAVPVEDLSKFSDEELDKREKELLRREKELGK